MQNYKCMFIMSTNVNDEYVMTHPIITNYAFVSTIMNIPQMIT